ncbi:uncharacterized protein LOC130739389 [Lotus japonicus]|uniref:uncharacterized protein LOC130739389 n=1 Tax=Lotus japonicus TaxID=34305 RepID=UPI00258D255D|nr:uncharacterized protein LOC130739389 [Lotus japonicus]
MMITSSISYTNTVAVPLNEYPWASFDHYLEDMGRVIRVLFPKKSTTEQLNQEEWRVKMTPVKVLFLKCQPVIHIIAKCISEAEAYPPEIPGHITKLLQIHITRCELQDLHADYMPQGFSVDARGSLFLERQGKHNWIKYQLDVSLKFVVPPLLSWVPKHVLQRISESILRNYAKDMSKGLAFRLLADYNSFKRNKPGNSVQLHPDAAPLLKDPLDKH